MITDDLLCKDMISRRSVKYLRAIKACREERGPTVYTDETNIHTSHTTSHSGLTGRIEGSYFQRTSHYRQCW